MHAPETSERPAHSSPTDSGESNGAGARADTPDSSALESAGDQPPGEPLPVSEVDSANQELTASHVASKEVAEVAPEDQSPQEQTQQPIPTLSRGDLWFVCIMLTVILLLSAFQLYQRYGWGAREIEVLHPVDDYRFTLDVNSATWVEWLQLDGVGEVLARRIVEHRERHGPFRSIEDLNNVHGIGDATLEKLRPYLRIDPPAGDAP